MEPDDNVIVLSVSGSNSVKNTTEKVIRSLRRAGYRIDQSDKETGYVQTKEKTHDRGMMNAEVTVRLDATIVNPSTAELTGEFKNYKLLDNEEQWEPIGYADNRSDDGSSWDMLLKAAEQVGSIDEFEKR